MTKRIFIEKLRKNLAVLQENEINEIVDEYINHIDEKVKSGKTITQAISEFGDIDELTNEILAAYRVKQPGKKSMIDDLINNLVKFISDSLNKILNMNSENTINFIVKGILLLLALGAIKWILSIFLNFVLSLLGLLSFGLFVPAIALIALIFEALYLICSIYVLYRFVKIQLSDEKNKNQKKGNMPGKYDLADKSLNNIIKLAVVLCVWLPLLIIILTLIPCFIYIVAFSFKYYAGFWGIFVVLGLLLMSLAFFIPITKILWRKL